MLEVGTLGVLLSAARGTDAEPVTVAAHEADQVASMSELWVCRHEWLPGVRRVAAQREDVGDPLSLHPVENPAGAVGRVGAREMGHRLDVVVTLDSSHQLERLLA